MGQVFAATHETLGRRFAIKFLNTALVGSQEAAGRFQEEVRSLGQLQHPNVVRAVDAGHRNGIPYLVTEFVDGVTLAELVARDGVLSECRVLDIAKQIASGLHCIHQSGFVHRDIKPSNVMITSDGGVQILDLGIARHCEQSSSLTASGQLMGTVEYLAPEQAADAQSVDGRSDLYGLGCTLIFLLTGQSPFPAAEYPGFASQVHAHLFETPQAIRNPSADWTPTLQNLLRRLVARNPADRFVSASEMMAFIDDATSHRSSADRKSSTTTGRAGSQRSRFTPGVSSLIFGMLSVFIVGFSWSRSNSNVPATKSVSIAASVDRSLPDISTSDENLIAFSEATAGANTDPVEASSGRTSDDRTQVAADETVAPANDQNNEPAAEPQRDGAGADRIQTVTHLPIRSATGAPRSFSGKPQSTPSLHTPAFRTGQTP